jgi:single-strand DNA-binding protein
MLNHVELLGRLAQEPEIRYTQGGTPVASFDLAVQVPSKSKDAAPDYIPIVCWRERAEFCGRYLSKGRQIVVEGRISTRKWKDEKTGQNRKAVEVTASNIYFADSNGGNANGNSQPANNDGFMDMPDDGQLPFN